MEGDYTNAFEYAMRAAEDNNAKAHFFRELVAKEMISKKLNYAASESGGGNKTIHCSISNKKIITIRDTMILDE